MYSIVLNENASIFQPGGKLANVNLAKVVMSFGHGKDMGGYVAWNSTNQEGTAVRSLNVTVAPVEVSDSKWDFLKINSPLVVHAPLADAVASGHVIVKKDGVVLTATQVRG